MLNKVATNKKRVGRQTILLFKLVTKTLVNVHVSMFQLVTCWHIIVWIVTYDFTDTNTWSKFPVTLNEMNVIQWAMTSKTENFLEPYKRKNKVIGKWYNKFRMFLLDHFHYVIVSRGVPVSLPPYLLQLISHTVMRCEDNLIHLLLRYVRLS